MTSPARRQYLDIKAQHQDAILLYQVGDFYETFDEDARVAARELQIVLTARSYGADERVPLAGVPLHALENYAAKLVSRGFRVAICEQVSPPGRGLVKREVTRILTPGTVVDPGMMSPNRENYLAAIAFSSRAKGKIGDNLSTAGLAYIDASTGAFYCTEWPAASLPDALRAELHRLSPAEILLVNNEQNDQQSHTFIPESATRTTCPSHFFDVEQARMLLCRHFGVSTLAPFGCEDMPAAIAAAGAILAYVERMNPTLLRLLTGLQVYSTNGFVEIDGRTWRALEVVEHSHTLAPIGSPKRTPTLLETLDSARTQMGARLLRRTLLQPLRDRLTLEERLDAIANLHDTVELRERLGAALDGLGDLERLTGRIVSGSAIPRELHTLAATLSRVPFIAEALRTATAAALIGEAAALDPCQEAQRLIAQAIAHPEDSQATGTIRAGYNAELDAMVASISGARAWIAGLEAIERERTGIKSLKVGYNKVFGYYLDVTRPNLDRVPPDYQRRQTLTNGERYVTADLKEHEAIVLHGEEQITELERTIYNDVLNLLAPYQERLRATAIAIAQLDVWLSLATIAIARNYVRPELTDSTDLEISGGRHPIVETTLDGAEFIPNETRLGSLSAEDAAPRIMLLTGPNMAGKSTYLRQVATIVLLAQIGSFVPATNARIGLVDRIFTRVGAEDDLARGLSTFMLEMVETAYILRHASARSLVILDEVGRGTSTHDGLAIARAVIEYLHDVAQSRTLFATHYHELSALAEELPRLSVFRMAVAEKDGEAIFLHRIVSGASDNSYGVQVARMAGLPQQVTQRAMELLNEASQMPPPALAERRHQYSAEKTLGENIPYERQRSTYESSETRELALSLAGVNIAAITPLEALNLLFSLQQRALVALRVQQE